MPPKKWGKADDAKLRNLISQRGNNITTQLSKSNAALINTHLPHHTDKNFGTLIRKKLQAIQIKATLSGSRRFAAEQAEHRGEFSLFLLFLKENGISLSLHTQLGLAHKLDNKDDNESYIESSKEDISLAQDTDIDKDKLNDNEDNMPPKTPNKTPVKKQEKAHH